jgi:hypothetical protein
MIQKTHITRTFVCLSFGALAMQLAPVYDVNSVIAVFAGIALGLVLYRSK